MHESLFGLSRDRYAPPRSSGMSCGTSMTDTVELWLIDLAQCAASLNAVERAEPRLGPDELARAASIADPQERTLRVAAYTARRMLLERFVGPSVRSAPLLRHPDAKPRLESGSIDFSLSHAGGFALIGISQLGPIGVDIEGLREVRMLADRRKEIETIGAALCDQSLPVADPDRAFIQAWARLEAFSKARGSGLSHTLSDLGARGSPRLRPLLEELRARTERLLQDSGMTVQDVPLPIHYGAVATSAGSGLLPVRTFPSDSQAIEALVGWNIVADGKNAT